MTSRIRRKLHNNRQGPNKGLTKVVNKVVPNNIDQKVHQECPVKEENKSFEKKKAELLTETQQYMYSQSSKFSSVSRNLIFGTMGTIWAFSFTNGEITINNVYLMIALLLCVLYLMFDVIHYYTDTNSYNKEQYNLDNYKDDKELNEHEKTMDSINKRSNRFIVWKFRVLIVTSIMFVIGLLCQTQIASPLISFVVMLF